jgi:hypothetical protein
VVQGKLYAFHQVYGHTTEECRAASASKGGSSSAPALKGAGKASHREYGTPSALFFDERPAAEREQEPMATTEEQIWSAMKASGQPYVSKEFCDLLLQREDKSLRSLAVTVARPMGCRKFTSRGSLKPTCLAFRNARNRLHNSEEDFLL